MKLNPCLILYTEISSKWIKELNLTTKTINLLEENMTKLHDIEFGSDFLNLATKTKATKETLDKVDLIKIFKVCTSKDTKRVKRQPTEWEKIFANHLSEK